MGRDLSDLLLNLVTNKFQSTLPAWGETWPLYRHPRQRLISIHSPRMGRDQSVPSVRISSIFISIHSPRMGRDGKAYWLNYATMISIHSPRMGRDCPCSFASHSSTIDFNPLSPHGERPPWGRLCSRSRGHFNPLSPHGERLSHKITLLKQVEISIHSPRMGRDENGICGGYDPRHFNPLSPHGERPRAFRRRSFPDISIHSPRMGRDSVRARSSARVIDFNPLSPHGERLMGLNLFRKR